MEKTFIQTELGSNENFYKYIFKKTEKIVYAVFYIIRHNTYARTNNKDILIVSTEEAANIVLTTALDTLHCVPTTADMKLFMFRRELVALESRLRLLHASDLLSTELLNVFVSEIDVVLRNLNRYLNRGEESLFGDTKTAPTPVLAGGRRTAPSKKRRIEEGSEKSTATTRRDAIVTLLKEKGNVSIKDVSDVITDCSEKTIQRDFNELIKDGTVERKGERRWAKYFLVQS